MRFRCFNPECPGCLDGKAFEFDGIKRLCPQCGASGDAVIPILIHHFLISDREGPIVGRLGLRLRVACSRLITRDKLASAVQMSTKECWLVNCPRCLETPEWEAAALPLFEKSALGLVDANLLPRFTVEAEKRMEVLQWR